jgi:hypothetical protein
MNLDDVLKSLTTSKKGIIVIILIFVAIFITNNLNFFKSISINISNEEKESIQKSEVNENDNKKILKVSESSMHISMTDFIYQNEFLNSPSYLSFTINNTSWSDIDSIDKIIIRIVHGGNLLYSLALPSDIIINDLNNTIIEFTKIYFGRSSMIKIYVLLEKPTFERIEIQLFKHDTIKEIVYLQKDIVSSSYFINDIRWYNFSIFLLFVLGFIILVIVFIGIYIIQKKLSG